MLVVCSNCGSKNRVDPKAAKHLMPKCGKCGTFLDLSKAEGTGDGKPVIVTDATFERALAEAGSKPILVDSWAPWCGPCRMVGPIMDELAADARGRYIVAKLNVDENPRTSARFQISSIPTMLLFKNGKLVDRLIGAQPRQAIESRLMQHLT